MRKLFLLLAILAFASPVFAQGDCEESCCVDNGGTWDGSYCSDVDYEWYDDCVSSCLTEQYSGGVSCCGPVMLVLLLAGAVAISERRSR